MTECAAEVSPRRRLATLAGALLAPGLVWATTDLFAYAFGWWGQFLEPWGLVCGAILEMALFAAWGRIIFQPEDASCGRSTLLRWHVAERLAVSVPVGVGLWRLSGDVLGDLVVAGGGVLLTTVLYFPPRWRRGRRRRLRRPGEDARLWPATGSRTAA